MQLYYDYYRRDESYFGEGRRTLDLDFQHRFGLLDNHEIIWGLGYRYTHDDTGNAGLIRLRPSSRNDQLFSAFIQDEVELIIRFGSRWALNLSTMTTVVSKGSRQRDSCGRLIANTASGALYRGRFVRRLEESMTPPVFCKKSFLRSP